MSNVPTLTERLEQADNSTAQSWIITELLLNAYPATIRQSVIAAAVPHWFTAEILAALLDLSVTEAEERYMALQQLSIVQPFGDLGYALHDLTRNGILAYLVTTAVEELQRYSQRVQYYFSQQNVALDPQRKVESIYHQLILDANNGRDVLKASTRNYRRHGDFAAIENLLRNYQELINLGLLGIEDQVELEQQDYWTIAALTHRGKQVKDKQSIDYVRKALEQFATPEQLPELLANEPEKWHEQIDTYKRKFVIEQIESIDNAGVPILQALWKAELSNIYRDQGDLDTALQLLDEALTLAPENGRIWAYRGAIKHQMQRYEEALADLDYAITLNDNETWAVRIRGETYRLMTRYGEALADFDRVIELDNKDVWAIRGRAETYRLMARHDEALTDFDHIVELDDKEVWAIGGRGYVYLLLGHYTESLTELTKALSIEESAWYLYCRGLAYLVQNQMAMAHNDLMRAIELGNIDCVSDPDDWRNTLNLMLYNLVAGDTASAERFLQEAFDRSVPAPHLQYTCRDLEELLTVLPDHAQAHAFLQRIEAHLADQSSPSAT